MCNPFNKRQPLQDEFHGLVMYTVAVTSIYFLFYVFKPSQSPKKESKIQQRISSSYPSESTSELDTEHMTYHEFKDEQRARYARHKTLKRRQTEKITQQAPLFSRQLTLKGFNNSSLNASRPSRNNSLGSDQGEVLSPITGSVPNRHLFNQQLSGGSQDLSKMAPETLNDLTMVNEGIAPNSNSKSVEKLEGENKEVLPRTQNGTAVTNNEKNWNSSSLRVNNHSSFQDNALFQSDFRKLYRNDAIDVSQYTSLSSISDNDRNATDANQYRRKYKTNFDRKISLRRKTFSAEMIKNS